MFQALILELFPCLSRIFFSVQKIRIIPTLKFGPFVRGFAITSGLRGGFKLDLREKFLLKKDGKGCPGEFSSMEMFRKRVDVALGAMGWFGLVILEGFSNLKDSLIP